MKKLFASSMFAAGLALLPHAAMADCGHVTIAEMNWASASAIAWIDKFILHNGYGCDAELVAGDTMPTIASMTEKGQPDIASGNVDQLLARRAGQGRAGRSPVLCQRRNSERCRRRLWIPKFFQDLHPELKTVRDVLKHPEWFPDPEDSSKGAMYNCPAGWSCQITTGNHYKAFKAKEAGFNLIDTGSGAGLDGSIAKAFEHKQGWFGYYWAPTAILGKYEMVRLDHGVPSTKRNGTAAPQRSIAPTPSRMLRLRPRSRPLSPLLSRRQAARPMTIWPSARWISTSSHKFLAWGTDNQATGEATAKYFLKNTKLSGPHGFRQMLQPRSRQRSDLA